jgi:hypothetical protein
MQIYTTDTVKVSPCVIVYGAAKSGKTRLIPTCPNPFVISSDEGLASIRDKKIPFCKVAKYSEFKEALAFAKSPSANQYQTIVIDDLSEVAEQILVEEKPKHKNTMQAFGVLNDELMKVIRELRAIPKLIVMICKQDKIKDETTGGLVFAPYIPGQAVQKMLPFLVDEVYHMESWTDTTKGVTHEVLRTKRDVQNQYEAGSRSGKLDELEFANLTNIFQKILS